MRSRHRLLPRWCPSPSEIVFRLPVYTTCTCIYRRFVCCAPRPRYHQPKDQALGPPPSSPPPLASLHVAQRPPHHARHVRPCSVPARPLGKQQESFSSRPPALALRPPPSPSALAVAGISSSSRAKWEGRSGRGPEPTQLPINTPRFFCERASGRRRRAAAGGRGRGGARSRGGARRPRGAGRRGWQSLWLCPGVQSLWLCPVGGSRWRSAAGGGCGGRQPSPASHSWTSSRPRHRRQ